MMPNATLEPTEHRDLKAEFGALALVLAVVAVGFGLATRPDPPAQWPSERTATAKPERTPRVGAQPVAEPRASAGGAERAGGKGSGPTGVSRKCAPEGGIADACVR